jgi:uncharacterized membrane protein YoaK (UPF0700 family)
MKVIRTQMILIFISIICFIFYFESLSNPLKDSMSLAVFIFIPYFAFGVFINYITIRFLEKYNKKFRLLNYLFSILYLIMFFYIKKWPYSNDFYLFISILLVSNLIGFFIIKDE